jgi:mannose-6-phosphate isomerase-like protein (cupin superfamily)
MKYSRRDVAALLPALLAAGSAKAAGDATELPSKVFDFDQLRARKQDNGNVTRPVLDGKAHAGCPLEIHITNLPAGGAPHPPHRHEHDEMVLVQEGTMEVTIEGKSTRIGPGSMAYVHSNEEHGWRNVGTTRAQYFVIAVGRRNT